MNMLLHMETHCVEVGEVIHFFLDGWMGWTSPCELTLSPYNKMKDKY